MLTYRFIWGKNNKLGGGTLFINLHTHSTYSDGVSTMAEYAIKAKDLGHVCLVVTDHDYMLKRTHLSPTIIESDEDYKLKQEQFIQQIQEAKEVELVHGIGVIVGLEITINMWTEALLFGQVACIDWFNKRKDIRKDIDNGGYGLLKEFLNSHEHALILCHPYMEYVGNLYNPNFYEMFHGYEIKNSGHTWTEDQVKTLKDLIPNAKPFKNYDAHHLGQFGGECNEVDIYIGNEYELIKWIREG